MVAVQLAVRPYDGLLRYFGVTGWRHGHSWRLVLFVLVPLNWLWCVVRNRWENEHFRRFMVIAGCGSELTIESVTLIISPTPLTSFMSISVFIVMVGS